MDFVLTERGRRLYATGELDFAYYAFFDDGIDYDPHSSGTLTIDEIEKQVESTPMLEAPFIHEVRGTDAPGEPRYHIFAAAPNYGTVPRLLSPVEGELVELSCDQFPTRGGYTRKNSSKALITMSLSGETEPSNPGYLIRVFSSGSTGLQEIDPRRDLSGRRTYDPFLAVSVDADPPADLHSTSRSAQRRTR